MTRPALLTAAGLLAWQLVPITAERGNAGLAAVLFVGAAVALGVAAGMILTHYESTRKGVNSDD